jgi:hypothetical protein
MTSHPDAAQSVGVTDTIPDSHEGADPRRGHRPRKIVRCLWSLVARHWLVSASTVVVAVGATTFILAYFEPQKLFINETVHEEAPTERVVPGPAVAATQPTPPQRPPVALSTGEFRSYEHTSQGVAVVLQLDDGERFVRFENFYTSNGPDLRVYLSTTPSTGPGDDFARDYVELGHLKGNIGEQNYVIPAGTALERYTSVVVWCKRFSVAFAAAPVIS